MGEGRKGSYGKNKQVSLVKTNVFECVWGGGHVFKQRGDKKVCDNVCLYSFSGLSIFFWDIKVPRLCRFMVDLLLVSLGADPP